MKPIKFRRLRMTARELVARWYGDRAIGEDALHDAVVEMMRRGWLTAFIPKAGEWDRSMVFVPQYNDFAAIIRYVDYTGVGVVPRGLVESRTQLPLANIGTGLCLSYIGIGITKTDGNNVFIRGTTPGLGLMAHQAHIHLLDQMPMMTLISATIGKPVARRLWNQELRLRVALAFDQFNIDVPGVLDGDDESDVQSRWLFPPTPAPIPAPKPPPTDCEPPFPAAPHDPPNDPDIPPF